MMRERTFQGIQRLLLGLCVLLTLLSLLVFFPLWQRDKQLEREILSNFNHLVSLNRVSPYQIGLDAANVNANLQEIKPQIARIRNSYLDQVKMLNLPETVHRRILVPFQTFEFILARNELSSSLSAKAGEMKVALDPSVLNGLPEYRYGMPDPQSLWIRLHACDRILNSAIGATPLTIQSFTLLSDREYYRLSNTNGVFVKTILEHSEARGEPSPKASSTNSVKSEVLFVEIPASIKFVGSMESVHTFLRDFRGELPPSMVSGKESPSLTNVLSEVNVPSLEETNQSAVAPQPSPAKETSAGEQTPPPAKEGVPAEAVPAPAAPAPAEAAPAETPKEKQTETVLRNSLFLGPFELHISPDNPDRVVLNCIVSVVLRLPKEIKE